MSEHRQGVIFDMDHYDYYISLEKETLKQIKEGKVVKGKIAYSSSKEEEIRNATKKDILLMLMSDSERNELFSETKVVATKDEIGIKISGKLLKDLMDLKIDVHESRYNRKGDKMHFIINENEKGLSAKRGFDNNFQVCLEMNKTQPTTGDLFESEYFHID